MIKFTSTELFRYASTTAELLLFYSLCATDRNKKIEDFTEPYAIILDSY